MGSQQTITKLLSITTALQIVRLDDFKEWIYMQSQPNENNWNVNGGLFHLTSETAFHRFLKYMYCKHYKGM